MEEVQNDHDKIANIEEYPASIKKVKLFRHRTKHLASYRKVAINTTCLENFYKSDPPILACLQQSEPVV